MMTLSPEEKLIRRYLLGELPEAERVRLEDRLFADDDFAEQLAALKLELADEYAHAELSETDRQRYEQRFLSSPQEQAHVAFAAVMARGFAELRAEAAVTQPTPEQTVSWWQSCLTLLQTRHLAVQFSLAAVMLALLLGGAWLFAELRQTRTQLALARQQSATSQQTQQELQDQLASQRARSEELNAQLQQAQTERERLQQELVQAQAQAAPRSVLSFILPPGVVRDSVDPTRLVVPRSASAIRLQLDLEANEQYHAYRAELHTIGGNLVWSSGELSARTTPVGQAVRLTLPAGILRTGDYELALKGIVSRGEIDEVGYYYLTIVRK